MGGYRGYKSPKNLRGRPPTIQPKELITDVEGPTARSPGRDEAGAAEVLDADAVLLADDVRETEPLLPVGREDHRPLHRPRRQRRGGTPLRAPKRAETFAWLGTGTAEFYLTSVHVF